MEIAIELSENHSYYGMTNIKVVHEKSIASTLFHELIHVLHALDDENIYEGGSSIRKNMIEHMTNLEEMCTITGFCYDIFRKRRPLKYVDILSESAFLIAKNQPGRIAHRNPNTVLIADAKPLEELPQDLITPYCDWLEAEIQQRLNIPKSLYGDIESLLKFLDENPYAGRSIPPSFWDSEEFALRAITNTELLEFIPPKFLSNTDFIKKAVQRNWLIAFIDSPLLSQKEHVLSILNLLSPTIRKNLYDKLGPELQQDTHVQSAAGISKLKQ